MNKQQNITNRVFLLITIIISSVVILYQPLNPLCYDVFGYYMYLPLKFKYNDLAIQNYAVITDALTNYHASETFYQAVKWENGNWIMRYPIGISVLLSPFYFIADFITSFTSYPKDGFSRPYQLCMLYAALLYALLGLHYIKKILLYFFEDKIAAITLFAIVLGTNFFFHVSIHGQGLMSHNFIFVLYAAILYYTIQWHQTFKLKYIIILGLVVGFNALCRPTEIISVLIPLLYGITNINTLKNKITLLYKYAFQIILFGIIIVSIGFIQFGYWYSMSGEFIINPYAAGNPGEGLELLQPHILKVLFSFRKGWFVYTPLMIFTVIGFWKMYKNNKVLFTPILIYFIINLYIVSCWSCWWYGACYGVRSLVPSYAALCMPLGYFVQYVFSSSFKKTYFFIMGLFVCLNLFQSWQMSVGIMDSTNMSRAYYFSTFLQFSPPTEDQKKLLLKGKSNDGNEIFSKEDSLTHALNYAEIETFENEKNNLDTRFLIDSIKHSGKHSFLTTSENPYTKAIEPMHEIITGKSYTWVKASAWLYSPYPKDSLKGELIFEMKHNGYTFKFKGKSIKNIDFKPNEWNKIVFYSLTPDDLRSSKDLVRVYFWNQGNKKIYVDDLILESYEPMIDKSVF